MKSLFVVERIADFGGGVVETEGEQAEAGAVVDAPTKIVAVRDVGGIGDFHGDLKFDDWGALGDRVVIDGPPGGEGELARIERWLVETDVALQALAGKALVDQTVSSRACRDPAVLARER